MARGIAEKKQVYARQKSVDVQQEKIKAQHNSRPPEGGENVDSNSNENTVQPEANQFSNDVNMESESYVSNKGSREIQNLISTDPDKPIDGMNQYLTDNMPAEGQGFDLKQLDDSMVDEENTMTSNSDTSNLTLNLSKVLKLEPDTNFEKSKCMDDSGHKGNTNIGSVGNGEVDTGIADCTIDNEAGDTLADSTGKDIGSTDHGDNSGKDESTDHDTKKKEIQVKSSDNGEKFVPNQSTQNGRSLLEKNVCPSGSHSTENFNHYIRDLAVQHHQERSLDFCKYKPRGIFHCHGDVVWKGTDELRKSYLEMHKESVGYIQMNGWPIGTCFRVGPKRAGYLLTAFHVFSDLYHIQNKIPTDDNFDLLGHPSIEVCFTGKKGFKMYNFKPVVHSGCPKLDYALLELKGENFTKPFPKFGPVNPDKQNFLHSYQDTRINIDDSVRVLDVTEDDVQLATRYCKELFEFDDPYMHKVSKAYKQTILQKEKVPILTKLRHGASGSPGFHIGDDGKPIVTYMFLRGYPTQYYILPYKQLDRSTFPSCLLVEQGLKILEAYESIKTVKSDLAKYFVPSV